MSFSSSIKFFNQSGLPVMVESWQQVMYGLNSLVGHSVADGEKLTLHSVTGEWHLNCMFDDMRLSKLWRDRGYHYPSIGKFSFDLDGSLQVSMDMGDFKLEYINGVIYFKGCSHTK